MGAIARRALARIAEFFDVTEGEGGVMCRGDDHAAGVGWKSGEVGDFVAGEVFEALLGMSAAQVTP